MKRICAITMVRNDDFYLRRWTTYYGRELGEENLFIYLDGLDQPLPDWAPKAHIQPVEKIPGQVVSAEKIRLSFLSERARELLNSYDLVIGTDADEFIIVDPKVGLSLREYLSQCEISTSLSALGVDVGQHLEHEKPIQDDLPFLQQRHYARLSTRYTKPSIKASEHPWGSGFHRIKGKNFTIDPNLYLFHFGYFDLKRIQDRFDDPDRTAAGWTKHIEKRAKTIRLVTKLKPKEWDSATRLARRLQTYIRPPYAWNKPAMLGMKLIVRIPERFHSII